MTTEIETFLISDTNEYGVCVEGNVKNGSIVYLRYSYIGTTTHAVFLTSEENKELVYQKEKQDRQNLSSRIVELDEKIHGEYLSKCGCYSDPPKGMKHYAIEYTDLDTGSTFLEDYLKLQKYQ